MDLTLQSWLQNLSVCTINIWDENNLRFALQAWFCHKVFCGQNTVLQIPNIKTSTVYGVLYRPIKPNLPFNTHVHVTLTAFGFNTPVRNRCLFLKRKIQQWATIESLKYFSLFLKKKKKNYFMLMKKKKEKKNTVENTLRECKALHRSVHKSFPLSDQSNQICISLSLSSCETRPGLCVCQSTCKVKAAEELTSLLQASISSESIGKYSEWRHRTVHIKRSTFLQQISQNDVLLFRLARLNRTLSSCRCDEIGDSLKGPGMFGVWIMLGLLYERARGRSRLISEHWMPFTDTIPRLSM